MNIRFPEAQPSSIAPLIDALVDALGPLVPASDKARLLEECAGIPLADIASLGLEITLPPAPAACDVSVLLAAGLVPAFVRDPLLHDFAAAIKSAEAGSTWWELDSSDDRLSVGVFIRLVANVESFEICRSAMASTPGLAAAVDHLEPLVELLHEGGQGLLGVFPDRLPAAAAALVPLPLDQWRVRYAQVRERVLVSADADSQIADRLAAVCDAVSVAVACDERGRTGAALEFGFADRIQAMREGRWATAIGEGAWGPWQEGLRLLLDTQGLHTFSDFLPMTVISGIDHLKITPDGRLKAYVGILPIYRGIGVNGLEPGTL